MSSPKPFATHTLPNGWTVNEFHAVNEQAFTEPAAPGQGDDLARFVVRIIRRHHVKRLAVVHLIGSTQDERLRSIATALRWASRAPRFPKQGYWSRRRDRKHPGRYYYTIVLGDAINEAEAFEQLRRGLHTDDAIDLEFQSIVQQIEVNA